MSTNKQAARRVVLAFAISLAVILLSRIPAMYVNPICALAGKMVLAACAVTVCLDAGILPVMLYAAAIPIFAWQMDIIEGQMAVAYALAAMTMMLIVRRVALFNWMKSAIAAIAAAVVLGVYSAALLTIRHEKTLFGALSYSFSRQALACVAMFIGAFIGSLRPWVKK